MCRSKYSLCLPKKREFCFSAEEEAKLVLEGATLVDNRDFLDGFAPENLIDGSLDHTPASCYRSVKFSRRVPEAKIPYVFFSMHLMRVKRVELMTLDHGDVFYPGMLLRFESF